MTNAQRAAKLKARCPALFAAAGEDCLVVTAQDGTLWVRGREPVWASLESNAASAARARSAPAVLLDRTGAWHLAIRGVDRAIWHRIRRRSGWSAWRNLGGVAVSGPSLVMDPLGRIVILIRGSDDTLWHGWFDSEHWSGWRGLGGHLVSSPSGIATADGRLIVLAVGPSRELYHRIYEHGWSPWRHLGGALAGDPGALVTSDGRLLVYGRGADSAVWYRICDRYWSEWKSLGGTMISDPVVAEDEHGRLTVAAVGADRGLWARRHGDGWSEWKSLGAALASAPCAAMTAAGTLALVARQSDGAVVCVSLDGLAERIDAAGLGSGHRHTHVPAPDRGEHARRIAAAVWASVYRAIASLDASAVMRLPADRESLEARATEMLCAIAPAVRRRLAGVAWEALGRASALERIDSEPAQLAARGSDRPELMDPMEPIEAPNTGHTVKLAIRKIQCIAETQPTAGADSMVLIATLIWQHGPDGSGGQVRAPEPVLMGDFEAGDSMGPGFGPERGYVVEMSLGAALPEGSRVTALFALYDAHSMGDEWISVARLLHTLGVIAAVQAGASGERASVPAAFAEPVGRQIAEDLEQIEGAMCAGPASLRFCVGASAGVEVLDLHGPADAHYRVHVAWESAALSLPAATGDQDHDPPGPPHTGALAA